MNSSSSRLIVLFAALGIALFAFSGVSQAQGGSPSPGLTDNPSDNNGNAGEFASGNPSAKAPSSAPSAKAPSSEASLPSTDPVASKTSGSQAASLPFTGYLAIPVLLLGVAMLGTGFLLRRRAAVRTVL